MLGLVFSSSLSSANRVSLFRKDAVRVYVICVYRLAAAMHINECEIQFCPAVVSYIRLYLPLYNYILCFILVVCIILYIDVSFDIPAEVIINPSFREKRHQGGQVYDYVISNAVYIRETTTASICVYINDDESVPSIFHRRI